MWVGLVAFPRPKQEKMSVHKRYLLKLLDSLSLVSTALVLLTGTASCTVKEERRECLSWVSIISRIEAPVDEDIDGMLSLFVYQNGQQVRYSEHTIDELRAGLNVPLKRRMIDIAGVIGWSMENAHENLLRISFGCECPEAWGFSDSFLIDENDEELFLGESLRSLFVDVCVCLLGAGGDYPYGLVVEGDVDGYLLASLKPHHGPFLFAPSALNDESGRVLNCRIPRQDDANLSVSLVRTVPDSATKAGENATDYVYTLPLGKILNKEGYDWNADNPEGIKVSIDFAATQIVISAGGWTKVVMMGDKYVI